MKTEELIEKLKNLIEEIEPIEPRIAAVLKCCLGSYYFGSLDVLTILCAVFAVADLERFTKGEIVKKEDTEKILDNIMNSIPDHLVPKV